MTFSVAIVGRPNVGKSTLFNRLAGKRLAIVDDTPGVTRDWREGPGRLGDLRFTIIDTAGLEEAGGESLESRMQEQTERVLGGADAVLLLIDARAGVTPLDEYFAAWLRRLRRPVILVANKCEGQAASGGLLEAYSLGFGEPVAVSAEHGDGMGDLYDALAPFAGAAANEDDGDRTGRPADEQPLQLAIVGRPNVGKSTLVNRLIGEDRVLTGPEAGVTRDAITVSWTVEGRDIRLVDTAGLRRKAKITETLEDLSVADALRAIRFAQVVVLVLDSEAMLEKQDLTIARRVIEEGRALVLAANKWDLVKDRRKAMGRLRDRMETSLPQVRGVPVITLSALTGAGTEGLLPAVLETFEVWDRRVPTGLLNRWLDGVTQAHPPPLAGGRRNRLRYITQAKTRPPTFVLFASRPDDLPEAYTRYLINGLRQTFDLPGVPLRLHTRKGKNPYDTGSKSEKSK
jgi:GTP-binding protein